MEIIKESILPRHSDERTTCKRAQKFIISPQKVSSKENKEICRLVYRECSFFFLAILISPCFLALGQFLPHVKTITQKTPKLFLPSLFSEGPWPLDIVVEFETWFYLNICLKLFWFGWLGCPYLLLCYPSCKFHLIFTSPCVMECIYTFHFPQK